MLDLPASPAHLSQIDFFAYHDLQAQCGLSVFENLTKIVPCNWRIGPHSEPTLGAIGAVMLDHSGFQKHVQKTYQGYKHLFHMSHDLGDVQIYAEEHGLLSDYDIIFTPSAVHSKFARKMYPTAEGPEIIESGWSKFDLMNRTKGNEGFYDNLKNLPCPVTILYAPTYAKNYEWKELLPELFSYPDINVIVKNHIYVNPGQSFPAGHEATYERELKSADEMEDAVTRLSISRFIVAPRALNICSLFSKTNLLISDSSSVLAEFLPFGNSIETGRFALDPSACKPEMSRLFPGIGFVPTITLRDALKLRRLPELLAARPQHSDFGILRPAVGEQIAKEIVRKMGIN